MSSRSSELHRVPSIVGVVGTFICITGGLFLIICGGLVIMIGPRRSGSAQVGENIAVAGIVSIFGGWILGLILYLLSRVVVRVYLGCVDVASMQHEIELTTPPV